MIVIYNRLIVLGWLYNHTVIMIVNYDRKTFTVQNERCECYKILQNFVISKSARPWQASPV
jgi:hypothetical protein